MSRLDDWRGTSRLSAPTASERAAAAWARINRKPDTITVIRAGVAQAAQVVRIEWNTGMESKEVGLNSGSAARNYVRIFGIQGHNTQADTDLRRGDKFKYYAAGNLANYEITSIDKTQIGEIQAVAEELQ